MDYFAEYSTETKIISKLMDEFGVPGDKREKLIKIWGRSGVIIDCSLFKGSFLAWVATIFNCLVTSVLISIIYLPQSPFLSTTAVFISYTLAILVAVKVLVCLRNSLIIKPSNDIGFLEPGLMILKQEESYIVFMLIYSRALNVFAIYVLGFHYIAIFLAFCYLLGEFFKRLTRYCIRCRIKHL